jgi:hypothetical protein
MKISTLLKSVALLGVTLLAAPAGATTQACFVKEVRSCRSSTTTTTSARRRSGASTATAVRR